MRTALVLLFALALAAVPGSLLPQRNVAPVRVNDYLAEHPTLGPLLDRLGFFAVYTSPWFSAVYLLLFVSLVGCIVPRIGVYARAMRAQPPRTPRNLSRLPAYASAGLPSLRRGAAAGRRAAPAAALPGGQPGRRRGRRARLPAGGGKPDLPRQPAVPAVRRRAGNLVRLPRQQRGDRRAGLCQQPDPVRRLQLRRPVHRGRPGAVRADRGAVRRAVRDRGRCSGGRPGCSGRRSR